jgi:3-oxoacyl-[acyl-carrier protein] reductase
VEIDVRKTALITGGTRGIGYGIARSLAGEGYDLALCGRRAEPEVTEALASLRTLADEVVYYKADISEPAERRDLIQGLKEKAGRLDLLVNNAGVAPKQRRDILEATEESFEWVLRVNLQGPYFLTQAAAKWMIEQKHTVSGYRGCIINVTSISASVASPNRGEYCISKAGLAMASSLWAVRLAEFGIPVYEVRPGIIRTDMTAGVQEKYDNLIANGLLLQPRWGTPEDVGRAVAMLARGDLAYSTGQVVMLDGGFAVQRL